MQNGIRKGSKVEDLKRNIIDTGWDEKLVSEAASSINQMNDVPAPHSELKNRAFLRM